MKRIGFLLAVLFISCHKEEAKKQVVTIKKDSFCSDKMKKQFEQKNVFYVEPLLGGGQRETKANGKELVIDTFKNKDITVCTYHSNSYFRLADIRNKKR